MLDRGNSSKEQFKELYEQYKQRIYNYVFVLIKNRADAEEVTQEVFVRVYRNLAKYDPEKASWLTWIYAIARNLSYNFIRDRKGDPDMSVDQKVKIGNQTIELLRLLPDERDPGAEKILESKEIQAQIQKAIEFLPDAYRDVITLCDIEEMPHKEAAEILGWSVSRTNVMLMRAREKLSDIIRDKRGD